MVVGVSILKKNALRVEYGLCSWKGNERQRDLGERHGTVS